MLELRTARLLLRPREERDAPVLGALLADPQVARWWPDGNEASIRAELLAPDEDVTVLAIEEAASRTVIGMIQFGEEPDPQYRHAGVDLFLGSAWWGRGFGPEAIGAVADHLFVRRGHHRLTVDPAADNARAIRAYARVGFRAVGVMRRYERGPDGAWRDGLLMELLASDRASGSRTRTPSAPAGAIELRPATPGDEDALLPMMAEFNAGEDIVVDPGQLRIALTRLLGDDSLGTVWCLESEGRRIGYAVVTYGYDLEFAGRDAFLTEIYLVPAARGGGLGRAALAALERATAAAGARALHLMVRFENAPAVQLYRSAGYASPRRVFLSKRLIG